MTYAELYAAIQSWTENTFPATVLADGSSVATKTQIDTFIKQAEKRIYNAAQVPTMRKDTTLITESTTPTLQAPDDFLYVSSMAVIIAGVFTNLLVKDPTFIREAYPSISATGVPKYYAIQGIATNDPANVEFILGPTPDSLYTLYLQYYAYPESIVTAGTTWLGDKFDHVLLYACLLEAAVFMKAEADTLTTYGARYQEALAQMKQLVDGKQRGDMYRNGQVKVPVT